MFAFIESRIIQAKTGGKTDLNRKVSNYYLSLTFLHVISLADISQNVQHYKSEQIYQ